MGKCRMGEGREPLLDISIDVSTSWRMTYQHLIQFANAKEVKITASRNFMQEISIICNDRLLQVLCKCLSCGCNRKYFWFLRETAPAIFCVISRSLYFLFFLMPYLKLHPINLIFLFLWFFLFDSPVIQSHKGELTHCFDLSEAFFSCWLFG